MWFSLPNLVSHDFCLDFKAISRNITNVFHRREFLLPVGDLEILFINYDEESDEGVCVAIGKQDGRLSGTMYSHMNQRTLQYSRLVLGSLPPPTLLRAIFSCSQLEKCLNQD